MHFQDVLRSEEELRALLGEPSELVRNKVIDRLDAHGVDFLAKSPLLLLATADAHGACDVSPRGDAPGFVLVLDERHFVIPERPGNKRMDSLRNILENPRVGLLFLIPGLEETLRVNGNACVIRDKVLLDRMQVNGKAPMLGIGVQVDEVFMHCAKALKRSKLWSPSEWLPQMSLPNPAAILADHVKLPGVDKQAIEEALKESYTKRLY